MAGTSLVEVLVVIVVLLIGILAVVQIFPSGLRILGLNRSSAIAIKAAQGEAERIFGRSEQLAEMIIPLKYEYISGAVQAKEDPDRSPNDFSLTPAGFISDPNGDVVDGLSNQLSYWPYVSGPNLFRRVVGEGGRVPAPRQVGTYFGGLMVLQFTPIVYNAADPGIFSIYGQDMTRRDGPPAPSDQPLPYEYYLQDPDDGTIASLVLPADAFAQREYRVAISCYVQSGTLTKKRDFLNLVVTVPAVGGSGGFFTQLISPLLGLGTDTLTSVEIESVKCARRYEKIAVTDVFTDPYQFKLLDPDMGLVLFSDQAFNAYELRSGHRVPLQARVNYDVYDWRIIRDEFRVPDGPVPQVKLQLGNLKVIGMRDVDGTPYQGLSLLLPTGILGETKRKDIALLDMDSGGIILTKSATRVVGGNPKELITVDRSLGRLIFNDADGDPVNGITGEIVYPGTTTATDINLTGRAVRAMYQVRGEWATQVLKAPNIFTQSSDIPGIAGYYVGGSGGSIGGNNTRIYFARCESGLRVNIDQIWYKDSTNPNPLSMTNQSFVIQSQPADPTGYPYIDIKSVNSDAQSFDDTVYGYSVAGVHGASVNIRVSWNPASLTFTNNATTNLEKLDVWAREWRRTTYETYVKRTGE